MSASAAQINSIGGLNRRTTELLLLLAAAPVIILLFCLALLNDGKAFDIQDLAVPLGLFAAFLISHLAVRWLAPGADPVLLPLTFALSGIGIAFVMRLAPSLAGRQVLWLFLAIACMIVTLIVVRSVKRLGDFKYTIIILGIIALLLPIAIGSEHNGSKIWLSLGDFSFQPGEIAKILIVLFLAGYLADNREMLSVSGRHVGRLLIPDLRTLAPLIVMWALSLLIVVFERDLGSALLFFGLFVIMIYIATGRITYVVISMLLGALGAVAAFLLFSHVQNRVDIWLDPFSSPKGGYQIIQALYSLADGDIIGAGIGRGMPDLIPIVASDFIFVAMAEEMGLLGASAILLLFVLFAVRGLLVASRAKSDMEAFTASGLTAAISLQAFVIVGGVTSLIPLTGVTLPFISQGGSSLVASFIIVGLLLRIGDSATGHEKELQSTSALGGGVLGRYALGKRLTLLVTVFSVVFAILIANLTYQMIVRAPDLRALPSNNHQIAREQYAQRGAILTADNVVLARSVRQDSGGYQRIYPEGSLAAHLVGYSTSRFGLSGIEATEQEFLRGDVGFSTWTDAINSIAGVPVAGNDVQLSIDSRIQRASETALRDYSGAVVALDAESGAVLSMASSPAFDINTVESLLESTGDDGSGLGGGTSALFNRATQALYSPGSTFKLVTLTAALSRAGITLSDTFDAPGTLEIGGGQVTNFAGTSYGQITVERALEVSANTVFAQIANLVGANTLVQTSQEFGFGKELAQDFYTSASLMPDPADMTEWETAWAGAGEPVGEHRNSPAGPQATVTQMALVASAFANNGTIMSPYLVASVISPDGKMLEQTAPVPLNTIASADVVAQVNQAMAGVVNEGFGYEAQIPGYPVYGKTGTAETNKELDDSWFVGYVEVAGRKIVVAIALEQSGGGIATPRAREVLEAAIRVYQ